MIRVKNPILRGFNPDPSILRVGEDYYIATSTFEWYPGVSIYHSKDLANWKIVARPLNKESQLNMRGNPSSGGIWAPCLTYDNDKFYLIYTDVKSWKSTGASDAPFKDTHNYLVTTDDIEGEWSEPIYLNSSGFDPSLFHDDDGRKWLVNMRWDYRKGKNPFSGILLQEYDPDKKKLVGNIYNIFKGTEIKLTEGPHIYKRNGYYYLMTAEGGTSYEHAVTLARSKSIFGPYEIHPKNPILTSYNNPSLPIQKSGHASLVEDIDGNWYLAHLCGRPLTPRGRCTLGRETALQKVEWKEDGWLYLSNGTRYPDEYITLNADKDNCKKKITYDFNCDRLHLDFQTLRVPFNEIGSLSDRKGFLRLYGRESIVSPFVQSVVARRQQAFHIVVQTTLEYKPENIGQMAGLLVKYDEDNQYYLRITYCEEKDKTTLGIIYMDKGNFNMPLIDELELENTAKGITLKAVINRDKLTFYYENNGQWVQVGDIMDASILSDEYAHPMGFTGTFVGMACQDLSGQRKYADFKEFVYEELED